MGAPTITGFDHLVLTCRDTETTLAWYIDRLGLQPERVDEWRAGQVFFPSVRVSADTIIDLLPRGGDVTTANVDHLCLVGDRAAVDHLADPANGFDLVDGPDVRFGARGDGLSVYVRDPDGTIVEVRTYDGFPGAGGAHDDRAG